MRLIGRQVPLLAPLEASLMHIVEYWMHSGDGDLDCLEGREWRVVRRAIAEAQANPTPKGEDGLVWVERVERHFDWRVNGEPEGDFDDEYETMWTHPDFNIDMGEWEE
jgi:hypothetical protein